MIDSLAELLTERGRAVGLRATSLDRLGVQNPPPHAHAWEAQYAWLVLWPVATATAHALQEASETLEEAVDPLLSGDAVEFGTLLDLYGVLVLPEPPAEDMKDLIRRVVQRRRYYRASVVWPESDGWAGLDEITLLDLPTSEESDTLSAFPALEVDEEELLAQFQDRPKDTGKRIAEEHVAAILGAEQ